MLKPNASIYLVIFSFILLFSFSCSKDKHKAGETFKDAKTGMEFVWVPTGCYKMGNEKGRETEKPVHEVCLDGFWLGKYEVTWTQWQNIMGEYVESKYMECPVGYMSWEYVQKAISRLNKRHDIKFRLPTEAEWEYAARSGGKDDLYSGGNDIDKVAWYAKNFVVTKSNPRTAHKVGEKSPNGLGLYDMTGNAYEMCADWFDASAYSKHAKNNPISTNSTNGRRVIRGGCILSSGLEELTTYRRAAIRPDSGDAVVGFRLVCLPQEGGAK